MVIAMSQPWKHPDTGVLYFRGRVPADIIDKMKGQKVTVRVGGADRTVKVAAVVKISLGTKVTAEAKLRHASVQTQLLERCPGEGSLSGPLPRTDHGHRGPGL